MKKIHEFSRSDDLEKFKLVLYAVRDEIANRTQFNREGDCSLGVIYAIKVGQHRFYSIYTNNPMDNYRELYVCKYEKKQTQKNNNTINETLKAIKKLEFNKLFEDGE
ncbi:hypothetical protein ACKLNQ_02510 [Myroides odoratimimus]|uniref:hypothetical protein n=1 Tax=Myroides odoratimimus TaxID=76832 RepID=UPI0038D3EB11